MKTSKVIINIVCSVGMGILAGAASCAGAWLWDVCLADKAYDLVNKCKKKKCSKIGFEVV